MEKKLRILAAGDFHGSIEIAKRISEKARKEKADLVVLAGDIAGMGRLSENILEPFSKNNQRVLFTPGNWDDNEDTTLLEGEARNIHGRYAVYEGVGLVGIGNQNWKMELDNGDFYLIKNSFDTMKQKRRILVSHLHAAGTKAEFSGIEGDTIVRRAVEELQPDVLISAHIHEAEGIEDTIGKTKIFQVGRKGTIIEV